MNSKCIGEIIVRKRNGNGRGTKELLYILKFLVLIHKDSLRFIFDLKRFPNFSNFLKIVHEYNCALF